MNDIYKNDIYKIKNPEVAKVFYNYQKDMCKKVLFIRHLILEAASEIKTINKLEETLKWGDPSYLIKGGSTIRVAWQKTKPAQYGVYFHCKTKLVETFKEIYRDVFRFEGNRAVIFNKTDKIPVKELKHCITLALTYHKRKHLFMLGV